jgi:serine/threonine-protein kinase HipA
MKKLSVIYAGWGERFQLGQLADDGRNLLFEYSVETLQRGLELSPLNLKLQAEAHRGFPPYQHRLPGLIADALPDGWGMLLMDRFFRKQGLEPKLISPLDRLSYIGDNAIGALIFEPLHSNTTTPSEIDIGALAKEIHAIVTDDTKEVLLEHIRIGGSPQGARPKAIVNFDSMSGKMSNSEQGAGVPWLIKFPAKNEHPEVCAIEAMYAQLAEACGIVIPPTQYFELGGGLSAFGVERFDRFNGMRVPTHTVAGVLNAEVGVPVIGYLDLLKLTRFMTGDEREVLRAFERCVFNVIFNNRDDHTKNFSYRLSKGGQWQISPAYDLTFEFGPSGEHSLDICGEGRAPTRKHLEDLAAKTNVNKKAARESIERIAAQASHVAMFAHDFPIRLETLKSIISHIEQNRKRML